MIEIREGGKGYQEQIATFIEEHRPLLKEPELSFTVLETTYVQGAGLLKSVSDELKRRQGPTVKATNALTDALNERPRVAPKIARLEKECKRLRGEFDRVNAAFNHLEPFIAEVKVRLDAEYEEDGTPKSVEQEEPSSPEAEIEEDEQQEKYAEPTTYPKIGKVYTDHKGRKRRMVSYVREKTGVEHMWSEPVEDSSEDDLDKEPVSPGPPPAEPSEQPEIDQREEVNKSLSWWRRLLGLNTPAQVMSKAAESYEGSPGLRESPLPASPLQSDPEDYQKFLDHYEENLEALEELFRTRAEHPVPYNINSDLPIRWQRNYETLTNKMGWCDRNMDDIEERNAKVANSELVDRRRDLAARRADVDI